MFLRELNQKQRSLFLDICIHMANADGCFSEYEKVMVRQLCDEMDIQVRYEAEQEVNAAVSELAGSASRREKRIIVLELAGLIMADNFFAKEEKVLLEKIAGAFDVDVESANQLPEIMRELFGIYREINMFLTR